MSDNNTINRFSIDVAISLTGSIVVIIFISIQTLIIPKYLSVADYGYVQLFNLYLTYAGILAIGFVEGVLLRWAGKSIHQVDNEINKALLFLFVQQFIIIIPLVLLSFIFSSQPITWLATMVLLAAYISNLTGFFLITSQAVKKFKLVTLVNITRALLNLVLILIFLLIGQFNYPIIILSIIMTNLIACMIYVVYYRKNIFVSKISESTVLVGSRYVHITNILRSANWFSYGKETISMGLFVTFGNFILVFLFSIDRILVSSLYTIHQFAEYAFAISVVSIIYMFINTISSVLFPYIARASEDTQVKAYVVGKVVLILISAVALLLYWPISILVKYYLPQYSGSLVLVQFLLCSAIFGSIIQIMHMNYLKLYGRQRRFFILGTVALFITITLIYFSAIQWGSLQNVAISMLVGFTIWYIINELSLRDIMKNVLPKIWVIDMAMTSYILAFLVITFLFSHIHMLIQMLLYCGSLLLITYILLKNEISNLFTMLIKHGLVK